MERLFDTGEESGQRTGVPPSDAPLAVRMRPRSLDELVGQEHLLGEGSALRAGRGERRAPLGHLSRAAGLGEDHPGEDHRIACRGAFEEASAVNAGTGRGPGGDRPRPERRRASGEPTIFFLDEIHRFNKAQQDALLPAVEDGLVTLIGATTENPYFEVNSALLSRTQL